MTAVLEFKCVRLPGVSFVSWRGEFYVAPPAWDVLLEPAGFEDYEMTSARKAWKGLVIELIRVVKKVRANTLGE